MTATTNRKDVARAVGLLRVFVSSPRAVKEERRMWVGNRASRTRRPDRARPRRLPHSAGPRIQRGGIAGVAGSAGAGRPAVPGVRAADDRPARRGAGAGRTGGVRSGEGSAADAGPRGGAEARTAAGPVGRSSVVRRGRRRIREIDLLPLGGLRRERPSLAGPRTGG